MFHDLACTLMVPVVLFRSGAKFGVLPADELDDGDDVEVLAEYDPWRAHRARIPTRRRHPR